MRTYQVVALPPSDVELPPTTGDDGGRMPDDSERLVMRLLVDDLARYDPRSERESVSRLAAVAGADAEHPDGVRVGFRVQPARPGRGLVTVTVNWTGTVRSTHTATVIHGYLSRLHELGFTLWDAMLRRAVTPTGPEQWLLAGADGADAATPSPATAPAVAVPSDAFDPLCQHITVDYLPEELGWRQLDVLHDACSITARAAGDDRRNPALEVAVMSHRGRDVTARPLLAGDEYQQRLVPAPPVGDTPAYWVETLYDPRPDPYRTRTTTLLRWADGPGYTQVEVYGPRDGARDLALRVAAGVRTGAEEPVRLPFALGPLPGGMIPQLVRIECGGHDLPWYAELRCAHEPMWGRPSPGAHHGLHLRCYPSADLSTDQETADRFVDGHPASFRRTRLGRGGGSDSLSLFNVDGHYLSMAAIGEKAIAALGPNGVLGLFRRLRFTPNDWTATPLN